MKKSYKGFVLWVIAYILGFFPIIHLTDGILSTRLTLLYTAVMICVLMLIIKKTDSIYWINGISFEDAEKVCYEKRMAYADAHLKKFYSFTVFYAIFTRISHMLELSMWIDTIVFTFGLIAAAVSTVKITLE